MTTPQGVGRLRHPAVVLVAGSGSVDRDEVVAGIPIFAQLAAALAEQGFIVLRYDKRGVGQSGGRSERVTLQDYADDLDHHVKWLAKRDDVDPRQIAVAGHSEGGAVAHARGRARREDRVARPDRRAGHARRGADPRAAAASASICMKYRTRSARQKIDLQKQMQAAVISRQGLGVDSAGVARSRPTRRGSGAFCCSIPAKVMPKIKQPILIIQGDLDQQVFPPHHADSSRRSRASARRRRRSRSVHLPGINHLLARRQRETCPEYSSLPDKDDYSRPSPRRSRLVEEVRSTTL